MQPIFYGKQTIDENDIALVVEALRSPLITTGEYVELFEQKLAQTCGAKYAISVSSGTAALHLVALALLNEGDKVLTTPNSFVATSNAILYAKAKPLFVDIDDEGSVDLDLCERELQKDNSIKALFAVAFSGKMLNQTKLKYLQEKYNLVIVEDLCHALGAKEIHQAGDIVAGSAYASEASVFSFHPVKHITTAEGGAITTNSKALHDKLKMLRSHGIIKANSTKPWEYQMQQLGFNYRLSDIHSALGVSQLAKLDSFVEIRMSIAKKYDELLADKPIYPLYPFSEHSSYHLYVVKIDFASLGISRQELFEQMREQNIFLQVHYIPIYKQPFYQELGFGAAALPHAERYYAQCVSLPIHPSFTQEEQEFVVSALTKILCAK